MSETTVEITSETRQLEAGFEKIERLQTEQVAGYEKMATAGEDSARQVAAAQEAATTRGAAAYGKILAELRRQGPEGREQAKAIEGYLQETGTAGRRAIASIVEELGTFDPKAAEVAAAASEKIAAELAAADAKTSFDNSLRELEKINPEAAKAARAVREHMDEADAQVKFDNIIAELEKLDPKAASEARAMREHMKGAADDGASSWESFSKSAGAQIMTVVAAYGGVDRAIQSVNKYLEEQREILNGALDQQIALAAAQQEAAKNLASYSAVERNNLLQEAVPEIARKTGFSDVAQLTLALGSAASAGATPQQAIVATEAAARMNRLTPDQVAGSAGGIVSVMQQTGLKDAREAAALLQTAGPLSKVDDANDVANTLPRALGTTATVPNQAPDQAAREIAAQYGVASNLGVDDKGNSTATFVIDFNNRMNDLFTNLEDKQIDARSKIELIDRKIEKGTDTEANRRDREQLLQFLRESEGMRDPGTISGRQQALQNNPALQQQFLGESGKFGEQQFQVALRQFLDRNSQAAQSLDSMSQGIRADSQYFEESVSSQENATPQTRLAGYQSAAAAQSAASDATNYEGANLAAMRENVAAVLKRTRSDGVTGFISAQVDESGISSGMLSGSTFAEESVDAINTLRGRIAALAQDGITEQEQSSVSELQSEITKLTQLMQASAETGTISRESVAAGASSAAELANRFARENRAEDAKYFEQLAALMQESLKVAARQAEAAEENNRLMAEQNAAAQETAANTRPGPAEPPDYIGINEASAAEEDAR